MIEQGVVFDSNGKQLVGIEHLTVEESGGVCDKASNKGVIIVVGGPQTRVGSHRLFVYLARALAIQGITVFRFDYTGAGDSEGEVSKFTDIQGDIDAAVLTFSKRHPKITELALWGLCDAATAILLYLNEYPPQALKSLKINQLFLVNPWVRQAHTEAKTYLRSYYIKRFFSKAFWLKVLAGKVQAKAAFSDIQNFHQQSQKSNQSDVEADFVSLMLQGLNNFNGQTEILLSGNDLTADEFKLLVKSNKDWREIQAWDKVRQSTIAHADHTFSQREQKKKLISYVCNAMK